MRNPLIRVLSPVAALLVFAFAWRGTSAEVPKPSPYPITWELKFEYEQPRRVVVDVPRAGSKAYWYMTYTVTNETDEERTFLPLFQMLTRDGRVFRSDQNIPKEVFDVIKQREGKRFLEPFTSIGGDLRIGEDEAREGVAIWEEPEPRMGNFTIFVTGLSGEAVVAKDSTGQPMKDTDGRPILLRKTLQLDFHIPGDEVSPGDDPVKQTGEQWIMR
jgi:hypothetical protein